MTIFTRRAWPRSRLRMVVVGFLSSKVPLVATSPGLSRYRPLASQALQPLAGRGFFGKPRYAGRPRKPVRGVGVAFGGQTGPYVGWYQKRHVGRRAQHLAHPGEIFFPHPVVQGLRLLALVGAPIEQPGSAVEAAGSGQQQLAGFGNFLGAQHALVEAVEQWRVRLVAQSVKGQDRKRG